MVKKFKRSLFIFRRDLRLEDNAALIEASKASHEVVCIFIFTPEQIDNNPYLSQHCLKFMLESLLELQEAIQQKGGKLFFFRGQADTVLERCLKELQIGAVFVNRDYTPYSLSRDNTLIKMCKEFGIYFYSHDDALLFAPEETLKKNGAPYTIFTPFFKNAQKLQIAKPSNHKTSNFFKGAIPFALNPSYVHRMIDSLCVSNFLKGGRREALNILKKMKEKQTYALTRDFPSLDATSHLSPYLKFTLCSPREAYEKIVSKLGLSHELIRSLHWRDFFTQIAFFFPHVFGSAFHSKFDRLKWADPSACFQKWCEGNTGFPIVDAGMREMNATGFMHNRVRMIAASFLVKDLHIDWRLGEKYFAQTLIDYDPAVNNGNWQWAASTGCDAQPYFRIFNPWLQQEKFDVNCLYIKKWIPELRSFNAQTIHKWFALGSFKTYPAPIVDHAAETKKSLCLYSNL